jgi:hypothetical protein
MRMSPGYETCRVQSFAPEVTGFAVGAASGGADVVAGLWRRFSSDRAWLSFGVYAALDLKQLDVPVMRHSRAVGAAMMQAMATVLASAGFSVEDARDEYRPQQMRVLAGPPSQQQPVWPLRDDELTLPGWQDAPAGGTD